MIVAIIFLVPSVKSTKGHKVALSSTGRRIACGTYLADKSTLRCDGTAHGESDSEWLELSQLLFTGILSNYLLEGLDSIQLVSSTLRARVRWLRWRCWA